MNAMTRNPLRPATRLDVQRHSLEDKCASYTRMDAIVRTIDARGDRDSRLVVIFQSFRASIANLLIATGERIAQKSVPLSRSTPSRRPE